MYKSLVRPHLDCCNIIFHIPHRVNTPSDGGGITLHHHMASIEQVQYQAALAITQVHGKVVTGLKSPFIVTWLVLSKFSTKLL